MLWPYTFDVVVLLIEAALFALAVVHYRTGRFPRLTRRVTLAIVIASVPISVMGIGEAIWEMSTLPFTRPGNAFGTYWEPTGLMIAGVLATAVLFLAAAVVSFFRQRWAAMIYLIIAIQDVAGAVPRVILHAAPAASSVEGVVVSIVPTLVLAALMLSLRDTTGLLRLSPHHPAAASPQPQA